MQTLKLIFEMSKAPSNFFVRKTKGTYKLACFH